MTCSLKKLHDTKVRTLGVMWGVNDWVQLVLCECVDSTILDSANTPDRYLNRVERQTRQHSVKEVEVFSTYTCGWCNLTQHTSHMMYQGKHAIPPSSVYREPLADWPVAIFVMSFCITVTILVVMYWSGPVKVLCSPMYSTNPNINTCAAQTFILVVVAVQWL